MTKHNSEKGSAFFYILLAVVLFGTLAFTISRGMRGQQANSMTDRKAEIASSDLLNYMQDLQRAVDRVRQNGCSENNISFANSTVSGYEHSPVSPNKCKIFHSDGGNLSLQLPPEKANDGSNWYFTATTTVTGIGLDTENDLVVMLFNVNKKICLDINKRMNLGKEVLLNSGNIKEKKYKGIFGQQHDILSGSTSVQTCPNSPLCKKYTGCFQEESTDKRLILYHVLLDR